MTGRQNLNIHSGTAWRQAAGRRYGRRRPLPTSDDELLIDAYRPTGQDDPWIPEGPGVPEPAPPEGEITMDPMVLENKRPKIAPKTVWMAAIGLAAGLALWSVWDQSSKR